MNIMTKSILFVLSLATLLATTACSSRLQQKSVDASNLTAFPHERFDKVTQANVDDTGRVDYTAVKANSDDLEYFTGAVASAGPTLAPNLHPDGDHGLAYYINGYNSLAMLNVLSLYPGMTDLNSIAKQASFFVFTKVVVDGKEINLKDLENDVIRPYALKYYQSQKKVSKLGRIHFALNCASVGCPQLPSEAFTPEKLEEQLDRETNKFVREKRNVSVDHKNKVVTLNKIFEWYAVDFTDDAGNTISQLKWINYYLGDDEKVPEDYAVQFRDYDWNLNDQALAK